MPQGESKFIRALYYAALGEKQKALSLSRRAGVLALLGMKKEAITAIADWIKNRSGGISWPHYLPLRHLPIYDNLRDDPRIREILESRRKVYEQRLEKYRLIETG